MLQTDQSILVNAPLHTAFAFVADYRNAIKYERHFSKLDPLPGPRQGYGTTLDARGRFRGIPVRSTLRIVEFVEDERIVSRSIAGLHCSLEWDFGEENGRTRVRLVAKYALPLPFVPRTVQASIEREIQAITTESLLELRRLLEVRQPAPASEPASE